VSDILSDILLGNNAILGFALAILFLDAFDISLPRGDSVGVAGTLVAASISIDNMGPAVALLLGASSVLLVQVFRFLRHQEGATLYEIWIRLGSTLTAVGAFALLQPYGGWVGDSAVILVPAALLLSELAARQVALSIRSGRSFKRLLAGNLSRQGLLFASEVSVAALTVILFDSMGVWTLIPVLALLILIRQSYAMLLEIRETYHTTVSVLVEAAEIPEPGRQGHSERVAEIAREIGAKCGMSAMELERLSYAALLHDVHGISDSAHAPSAQSSSSDLVREVGFLAEVVPILRVVDGQPADEPQSDKDLLSGFIVALASDVDSATRTEVAEAHREAAVPKIAPEIPSRLKARAVSAAVSLGLPVPAID
jgi:hypothetical protein